MSDPRSSAAPASPGASGLKKEDASRAPLEHSATNETADTQSHEGMTKAYPTDVIDYNQARRLSALLDKATSQPEAHDPAQILVFIKGAASYRILPNTSLHTASRVQAEKSPLPSHIAGHFWTLPDEGPNDEHLLDCYAQWVHRHGDSVPSHWFRRALWGESGKMPKLKFRWLSVPSLWHLAIRMGDGEFMNSVVRETVKSGNEANRGHVVWEFLAPMDRFVPEALGKEGAQGTTGASDLATLVGEDKLLQAMVEVFCKRTNNIDFGKALDSAHLIVKGMMTRWMQRSLVNWTLADAKVDADDYIVAVMPAAVVPAQDDQEGEENDEDLSKLDDGEGEEDDEDPSEPDEVQAPVE